MCVTSRGSRSLTQRSFTYSHYLSFWVCMRVSRWSPSPPSLSLQPLAGEAPPWTTRKPTLPIYHYPPVEAPADRRPLLLPLTSVMKRLLPSSFTLPIYRFNYRLMARCSRSPSCKNPRPDHTATLKRDLIRQASILIDDKRFVRFTDIARDYRLSRDRRARAVLVRAHLRSRSYLLLMTYNVIAKECD